MGLLATFAALAACSQSHPSPAAQPSAVDAAIDARDAGTAFDADNPQSPVAQRPPPALECRAPERECHAACREIRAARGARRVYPGCGRQQPCAIDLRIGQSVVLDVGTCARIHTDVTVYTLTGDERIFGELTTAAWDELLRIVRGVNAADLPFAEAAGDCPDCEGVTSAALSMLDDAGNLHEVRYPLGSPPAELREADAFMQALIDQQLACGGELLVPDDECWRSLDLDGDAGR